MKRDLNIIDLISEKHIILRRGVEERWAELEEEDISHTEALLLAKINMGKISIAEVARQANISRQAMFKCAKKLEMRGYLKFVVNESNNKYTELTVKGKDYCKKSTELKEQMEREIAEVLGKDKVEALKDLLSRDWSIK
ncbi:MarR family transcriptional regulator [Clostridium perfringens]|uniref:MarR family winged helix-turn-helix transcriptional regulator n=1 Tax=Clostridium perfringens TaxID=1502 RepID=UPI001A2517E5|nr:MarR family transcriptional regulator [Clostridium perfringens]EGT2191548.1 MarR family transcriptional regulator [Clostridium perfringens]MCC5433706.1 MarR family transcriptional regulator [Clostridium perfringens]MCC5435945.1 MarR family transcriptional regulator [Clostridium perfringens]MCC5446201.1 MarR family transcriptional regulator [Clostridium perfringens]MCC5449136.1 MarR family transcriptional regulator [Clostridium perfringens]